MRIIEIFLSLSLSSVAGFKKGPFCQVCPLPNRRGLRLSGRYRGCRGVIGAVVTLLGLGLAEPRLPLAARERMPVGAWDGWVQLWRLLAPSGSGGAGRETLPALGIHPSPVAAQPCHLALSLPGPAASPGPLSGVARCSLPSAGWGELTNRAHSDLV